MSIGSMYSKCFVIAQNEMNFFFLLWLTVVLEPISDVFGTAGCVRPPPVASPSRGTHKTSAQSRSQSRLGTIWSPSINLPSCEPCWFTAWFWWRSELQALNHSTNPPRRVFLTWRLDRKSSNEISESVRRLNPQLHAAYLLACCDTNTGAFSTCKHPPRPSTPTTDDDLGFKWPFSGTLWSSADSFDRLWLCRVEGAVSSSRRRHGGYKTQAESAEEAALQSFCHRQTG